MRLKNSSSSLLDLHLRTWLDLIWKLDQRRELARGTCKGTRKPIHQQPSGLASVPSLRPRSR